MPLQICKSHWQQLKAKVNDAGLGHFVSPTGYEALRRLDMAMQNPTGEITLETYDPVLFAHTSIFMNAIQVGGVQLATAPEVICPICALGAEDWLTLAVADAHNVLDRISKGHAAA